MYEVKRPQIRYSDELDLGLNCAEGFKDVSFDLSLALSEMPVGGAFTLSLGGQGVEDQTAAVFP